MTLRKEVISRTFSDTATTSRNYFNHQPPRPDHLKLGAIFGCYKLSRGVTGGDRKDREQYSPPRPF